MTDRFRVRRRSPATPHPFLADASDRTLDELLRSLPPAPERFVGIALELPRMASALGHLRREGGELADDPASLRSALEDVGLEPDERRLRALGLLRRFTVERDGDPKIPQPHPPT